MINKSGEHWFRDNCYNTLWIDHNIDENSTVVELGGYKGRWTDQIIKKYNPRLFVLEPIKEFYEDLKRRFSNDKVTVLNVGVSTQDKFVEFVIKEDSTSQYIEKNNSNTVMVELWAIEKLLELTGEVDLIQINIEGEEYPLLEYLIENDLIYKFKRLMIEFHFENKEGFPERRRKIQEKLNEKGYENLWNYDWLFEYWELKK